MIQDAPSRPRNTCSVLFAGLLALAPVARAEELNVFAAASLTDALKEIASEWEKASGHKVVFNLGASNDLARQIRAGAPADVFFSADKAQMDGLERDGLVRGADRVDLLSNTLVVVAPAESSARLSRPAELAGFRTIALADPQAVPAGIYARTWLERLGLWTALEGRIVPALNVRAALAAVESGNVEAGIVYKTDAALSKRARVLFEVPRAEGPAIVYPLAPVATSSKAATAAFVQHLQSAGAREVFARYGFVVLRGQ
jgi:molybdate transport system substrate-binding protein